MTHLLHQLFLHHPQPISFPQCQETKLCALYNNRQTYSSVELDLHIFREQLGR
jgi:hypothetical protein